MRGNSPFLTKIRKILAFPYLDYTLYQKIRLFDIILTLFNDSKNNLPTEYKIKEQSKKDEEKYYRKKYGKVRNEKIPRFYFALPKETEIVKLKLREEARAVFLQRKSRELIDNDELQKLWFTLVKG